MLRTVIQTLFSTSSRAQKFQKMLRERTHLEKELENMSRGHKHTSGKQRDSSELDTKWNLAIKYLAVAVPKYFKQSDIMSCISSLTQDLCPCKSMNFIVLGIGIRSNLAKPNCGTKLVKQKQNCDKPMTSLSPLKRWKVHSLLTVWTLLIFHKSRYFFYLIQTYLSTRFLLFN